MLVHQSKQVGDGKVHEAGRDCEIASPTTVMATSVSVNSKLVSMIIARSGGWRS
jgi:hypothetical protein